MRRSILALVKFLSRLFTALNLLPSIATLACVRRPIPRQSATNRAQTWRRPGADLADGAAVVLAEVGNRLVVGSKPARQPHHLNVASSFTLQSSARLHPVEIAIDVELQQHRWMIRRPAGYLGIDPAKPKFGQIEFLGKDLDHANRIVLVNPVCHAFRKKRALPAIRPLNEAL